MSFNASNNRIFITNSNNEVVFDTNNKMPAIVQTLTGSITVEDNNNGTKNYTLGSIPAGASFFLPMHRIRSTSGTNSWINQGYWETGIGTRITDAGWASIPVLGGNGSISYVYTSRFVNFTILSDGSRLYLQKVQNGGSMYLRIDYKILIGRVF